MAKPLRLVAYLLTRKKAVKIGRSVTSLLQVTPQNVIDSGSTDQTRTISTDLCSDVIVLQFEGFSAQRNWALDHVEDQYRRDYVPSLDADECLSDDRTEEICKRIADGSPDDHDVHLFHLHIRFARRTLRWRVSPTPGCFACPAPALGATRIEQSKSTLPSARLRLPPASLAPSRTTTLTRRRGTSPSTRDTRPPKPRPGSSFVQERLRKQHRPTPYAGPTCDVGGCDDTCGTGCQPGQRAGFRRAPFEAWQQMSAGLKAEAQKQCGRT